MKTGFTIIFLNLYSDKEILAEKYGYEYIDKELAKNSKFYNKDILNE